MRLEILTIFSLCFAWRSKMTHEVKRVSSRIASNSVILTIFRSDKQSYELINLFDACIAIENTVK